jgi:hypothetical protein
MDVDASSPPVSRRSSGSLSTRTLIVRLKVPSRALAMAAGTESQLALPNLDTKPALSPFPPSSPPTMASSPAPGAGPQVKRRGGGGGPKRSKPGLAPGAGVFSLNNDGGTGSGAGTPVPNTEKERAKPGPKANPGGINAGLRALDRSGKPTRRWQKVSYPVNTSPGYVFYTTTWVVAGNDARATQTDPLVPGDGLYEKDSKTEGADNQWNGEKPEGERALEHDITMEEAPAVVA